jgi:L-lactate dehydrogenase complex protein LldF
VVTRSFHGSPPFPEGAKTALRNPQLRANMAGATTTIRSKRDRVVAELQSWEDLRLSGEAIKTSALEHLDELLCALEARITEAGGVVHWANDAAEANRLIVGLVAATGYDEVVKVKSMTTAEIGLNQALESAGITAYETDLAELIVQLGDDLPSHIVVPAIHRSRQEIRKTFVDHMGEWGHPAPAGLSTEPGDLAAAARVHLRHRFLSAKVAICGANFLVAETGAIVIVESEGNGRMCVTLPETLIAVAGIDKVIPSWEDLDVFLQVLPRSATGERMNPYTSVWTGVRPGDGPQQYHLVLVDNGRSRALADPVGRQALRCIRCAACLNVCPVYERVGGHAYGSVYPGPIGAVLTPQLDQVATDDVAASLPYASTLCGACFDACPVRIDIPRLLVHLRAEVVDAQRETPNPNQERAGMALASWALARPRRLDFLARVGTIASRVLRNRPIRLPGWAGGWSATRAVPLPREDSFASWWRRTHPNEIAGDRFATIVSHRAGGPRPRWRRLRRGGG